LRNEGKAMRAEMANAAPDAKPLSAPEQTEAMIRRMSAHVDAKKSVLAAEVPLYAVLSDDQKKIADQSLERHGMMGRHKMGRGH
jgi:hypothetical protein